MCRPADDTEPFVADTLARLAAGRLPAVSLKEIARATELIDQAYRR